MSISFCLRHTAFILLRPSADDFHELPRNNRPVLQYYLTGDKEWGQNKKGHLQNVTTSYIVTCNIIIISLHAEKLCFKYAGIVLLQAKVAVHVPEVNANQLSTILGVIPTCFCTSTCGNFTFGCQIWNCLYLQLFSLLEHLVFIRIEHFIIFKYILKLLNTNAMIVQASLT